MSSKVTVWPEAQYRLLFVMAYALGGEWKPTAHYVNTVWPGNRVVERERCETIYIALCAQAKQLGIKPPKSWEAVGNQLMWAISAQTKNNSGNKAVTSLVRQYAIATGWISPETARKLALKNCS